MGPATIRAETLHCSMQIARVTPRVVLVTIEGFDVGELGDWPFDVLDGDACEESIDLFIDARRALGASMTVSGAWAVWLTRNRERLRSVTMVACARAVQVTAAFVRRFSGFDQRMHVTTDERIFESVLAFAALPGR
jgi:hypothetical protein